MNTTTEMELVPETSGENAKQLAPFDSFKRGMEKLKVTAETLTVTDVNDRAGMKLARATRLALRDVRIAVEHRRKELVEEHLKAKQRVDSEAKTLKDAIEPLEARLDDHEKFIEREQERIRAERHAARTAEVTPFVLAPLTFDLGALPDEQWATVLAGAKAEHEARLKKIEDDRIAAEAEKARIEAQRVENERLKAEAVERERLAKIEAERVAAEKAALEKKLADERAAAEAEAARLKKEAADKLEAERKAAEAHAAKLKAEADAKLKAERESAQKRADEEAAKAKAEAHRVAEIARKEREALEAKAKAEREQREALERAERERKAKEAQAEKERIAAERKAAAAPDKVKLASFADMLRGIVCPGVVSDGANKITDVATMKIRDLAEWIDSQSEAL